MDMNKRLLEAQEHLQRESLARAQEMRKLYQGGMTLEAIGERFGITRQRVFKILQTLDKKERKKK